VIAGCGNACYKPVIPVLRGWGRSLQVQGQSGLHSKFKATHLWKKTIKKNELPWVNSFTNWLILKDSTSWDGIFWKDCLIIKYFKFIVTYCFETRSCCVAQPGFELTILLPQPPECWDYRCVATTPGLTSCFPVLIIWNFKLFPTGIINWYLFIRMHDTFIATLKTEVTWTSVMKQS
jgi:hypothetical protein